jgi:hypothetical protein
MSHLFKTFTESLGYEIQNFGIHVILIEPGVIRTNFLNSMKLGKNVITLQNDSNINSPYTEMIQKRVSAFKPRFEKGSSPIEVAEVVLEAATSQHPKPRYLVGNDAMKMMEKRKDTADEEFGRLVMDSVLGCPLYSTIAIIDEVDARVREGGSIAARSFDSESGGSEIDTTVCGPDVVHACQSGLDFQNLELMIFISW